MSSRYAGPTKAAQRSGFYGYAEQHIGPRSEACVLYLETGVGAESCWLIARGYTPGNLHAVNRKKASMDNLGRKKLGVVAHRQTALRAAREWSGPHVDIVNLDFTGPVRERNLQTIRGVVASLRPTVCIVTFLRGREHRHDPVRSEYCIAGGFTDRRRHQLISQAATCFGTSVKEQKFDVYSSGKQSLGWIAMVLEHDCDAKNETPLAPAVLQVQQGLDFLLP